MATSAFTAVKNIANDRSLELNPGSRSGFGPTFPSVLAMADVLVKLTRIDWCYKVRTTPSAGYWSSPSGPRTGILSCLTVPKR